MEDKSNYIQQLESKVQQLEEENSSLKETIQILLGKLKQKKSGRAEGIM